MMVDFLFTFGAAFLCLYKFQLLAGLIYMAREPSAPYRFGASFLIPGLPYYIFFMWLLTGRSD